MSDGETKMEKPNEQEQKHNDEVDALKPDPRLYNYLEEMKKPDRKSREKVFKQMISDIEK